MTPIAASRCALRSATPAAQWRLEPYLFPPSVARGRKPTALTSSPEICFVATHMFGFWGLTIPAPNI